ncbi:right-handed parallel beta-helix repeat-containing protein [Nocardioides sp.]|uniref:right-handed parallel beta-helix repeat-containing protein n=1 Tax=Nocardioides sp. TaxID=35761 RepID=UPI002CB60F6F|nr:right-handed parallel beta-helix repeat-containing protein [Nocardioides sp.]HXH79298.1 right-handed parallel beta-helix repeat-containing protein [Nocardioides sp.]
MSSRITAAVSVVVTMVVSLLTTLLLTNAPTAAAVGACNKWAATNGNDGNPGTEAAPFRTLTTLQASLAPGQVGCLPANQTYYTRDSLQDVNGGGVIGNGQGTTASRVTITSGPGGRALIMGQLWLTPASHDVTFTNLNFGGSYVATGDVYNIKGTLLIVHGDRISITDSDITNPFGICVGIGKAHGSDATVNDRADDFLLSGSRIHGCAMDPTIVWAEGDSGGHGVYLENSLNARVHDNLIYRNKYRGLQLWPRNDGAHIHHNVFDRNATHVNIGSSEACGGVCRAAGFVSQNTQVYDNIFTHRVTDWRTSQNPSQLYGYFLATTQPGQYGNTVTGNCFAPGDPAMTGYGYTESNNVTAQAIFVNRLGGDYTLDAASPCLGKGPGGTTRPPTPTPLPDASVAPTGGAYVGDGTYNHTGASQSVRIVVPAGQTASFDIRLQNDSAGSDAWVVAEAPHTDIAGFTRAWSTPGANDAATVTPLVQGGNYTYDDVATGGTRHLRLAVTPGAATAPGTTAVWYLHLYHRPLSATTVKDVVQMVVEVGRKNTPPPPPPSCQGRVATVQLTLGQRPTSGNDVIVGTPRADKVDGGRGKDVICGAGGRDRLSGGRGRDLLVGGGARDTCVGGAGRDRTRQCERTP